MNKTFRLIRRTAAIFAAAVTLGVTGSSHAQQVIKIGVLAPVTGGSASDGAWLLKGHEMAAEEINQRGGIKSMGGAKVALVIADTQSKPETARGEAERLIEREQVSALTGAWASAVSSVVGQVAERAAVPFVITSAVADNLTEKNQKYVFRVSPKTKWGAEDVGKFIDYMRSRGVPVTKAAIAYEDGPYGQSVAANYKIVLEAKKVQIVADESFRTGTSDLSTQVTKMRAAGADVVMMAAYVNDSVVLFRAMAAQNYKPLAIGWGQGHVQPALLQTGKAVEGSFAIVEWMPDLRKDAVSKFVAAFEAKYKTLPPPTSAQAYAATWAIAEGLEKSRSAKPADLRDGLAAVKTSTGPVSLLPSNEFSFDSAGQHVVGNVVIQIIDNKFVTVWPPSVAVKPIVGYQK